MALHFLRPAKIEMVNQEKEVIGSQLNSHARETPVDELEMSRDKFANSLATPDKLKDLLVEDAKYFDELSRKIEALIKSQEKLSQKIELFVRSLRIFPSLGRGMALGFGLVIGSTVIVGFFVYLLTRAEAIPIVGDFVKRIIEYINIEHLSQ